MTDFDNVIVRKPWGYEYLMYRSDRIGLWYLHIDEGAQTSLHCHPLKKTGYILLSGEALVSFLNDSIALKAVSKLMIREGLFHSTKAVSPGGIAVIEVESPPDKQNLVRLDDAYGRKEKPYEGAEAAAPITDQCVILRAASPGERLTHVLHGVELVLEEFPDPSPLLARPAGEILLVLGGGLVSSSNDPIVSPGDVVSAGTFKRLAETFSAPCGVSVMTVRMPKAESAVAAGGGPCAPIC
jgi:mannose-6-phosphate isomerase-like protein (cupin superfamily)